MSFPPVVDDDGSGTTGTVLDKAFFDAYNAEIAARDTTAGTIPAGFANTGNIDLALPAAAQIRVLTYTGTGGTLRGFTGAAAAGDLVVVKHAGTGFLLLAHNAGIAGNQNLINVITSGLTPLGPGGAALYHYTGTQWLLDHHEQAAPYPIAYNAANYTTPGGGTWLVEAADVIVHSIFFKGRMATITVQLQNTTKTGPASGSLGVFGWGYTFAVASLPNLGGVIILDVSYLNGFLRFSPTGIDIFRNDLANYGATISMIGLQAQVPVT